jgi:hypothetical protein
VNVLQKTPAGAEEFAEVAVAAELDALAASEAMRAAFERR